MINTNFQYTTQNKKYTVFYFDNILQQEVVNGLVSASAHLPYSLISGKRTDAINRIWMHNQNIDIFNQLSEEFNNKTIKEFFGSIVGADYTNLRTRIELCKDQKNSWLEHHADDPAKEFTLQLCLTDVTTSTNLNNAATKGKKNSGWFFKNTGTEVHSLSPLPENRISIIVNYVNSTWKDEKVLV